MKRWCIQEKRGNVHGPALLFLHGFLGDRRDWYEITGHFEKDFNCLLPDLPGHGDSILLEPEAYSFEGVARQLIGLLDAENIRQASVIAYSLGARVALYTLLHYPDRFRCAVLESVNPGLDTEAARRKRREQDEIRARHLETGDLAGFLGRWFDMPMFQSLRRRPRAFRAMVARRFGGHPVEWARALRGLGLGEQEPLWDSLAGLRVPLLVITGEEDRKFCDIAARMERGNPNIQWATLPGCSHNVHFEKPTAYTECIRSFLVQQGLPDTRGK